MKLLEFSLHPSSVGSAQLESGGMGLNPIEVLIFFYPGFFSAKAKIPAHLLGLCLYFLKKLFYFVPTMSNREKNGKTKASIYVWQNLRFP